MKRVLLFGLIIILVLLFLSCQTDPSYVDDDTNVSSSTSTTSSSGSSSSSHPICNNYGSYHGVYCEVCEPDRIFLLLTNQSNWHNLSISNYFISIKHGSWALWFMSYHTVNYFIVDSVCISNYVTNSTTPWYSDGEVLSDAIGNNPIDGLFVTSLQFATANWFEIQYSEIYYFPTNWYGDYSMCIADEQQAYEVLAFTNYGTSLPPF